VPLSKPINPKRVHFADREQQISLLAGAGLAYALLAPALMRSAYRCTTFSLERVLSLWNERFPGTKGIVLDGGGELQ
jgi:hypothetical protein